MAQARSQKTVLITGCSAGGIGDALAQAFHRKGLRVFASARNLSKVQHLKEMGMEVVQLDVTDAASRTTAVEYVKNSTGGTLDILLNNAGCGYTMPLLDSDLDTVRKVFELNVFGVLETTKAFAPLLLKARGMIVNVSSLASVSPIPWSGIYCASKAALNQVSDTLRMELEPFGVKVILVITGSMNSNIHVNDIAPALPDNSLYLPIQKTIERVASGKQFEHTEIDRNVYAEEVVRNVLRISPTVRQWAGGQVTAMWCLATLCWATVWDFIYPSMFGLSDLKKTIKQTKRD